MLHIQILQLVNIQVYSYAENSTKQAALNVSPAQFMHYYSIKSQLNLRSVWSLTPPTFLCLIPQVLLPSANAMKNLKI